MSSKVYETEEQIRELIATNDKALARAILAIYQRQTVTEQACGTTQAQNGVGFNAFDAPFLTSIAKALPKWNNRMTPRQIAKARPMMMKYARQLLEIARERQQMPGSEISETPAPEVPMMPPAREMPVEALYGRF